MSWQAGRIAAVGDNEKIRAYAGAVRARRQMRMRPAAMGMNTRTVGIGDALVGV